VSQALIQPFGTTFVAEAVSAPSYRAQIDTIAKQQAVQNSNKSKHVEQGTIP
jgi:hypothetical protein